MLLPPICGNLSAGRYSIFRLSITRAIDFEIRGIKRKKYIEFGKRGRCIRMFAGRGEQRGNFGQTVHVRALRVLYKLIFLIALFFRGMRPFRDTWGKREIHSNEIPLVIGSKPAYLRVSTLVLCQTRTTFREQ